MRTPSTFLVEVVHILLIDCIWCVDDNRNRGYDIGVKGQCQYILYLKLVCKEVRVTCMPLDKKSKVKMLKYCLYGL